jgi:long-chain acyl-CoA synthetase
VATTERAEAETDTGGETMAGMVLRAAGQFEGTALRYKDGEEWTDVSYSELGGRVRGLAKGLIALGLEKGDAVAIFADTRPEWVLADLASACAGLVVACVYQTSSSDEAHHVLENSEARLCFVENEELLERVQEVQGSLERLEHIVLFEGDPPDCGMTLDDLAERGSGEDDQRLDDRVEEIASDNLFTLVYTSGTTGPPKGCMLTHGNLRAGLDMFAEAIEVGEDSIFYAFLPLAHVLTRATELLALDVGATIAFWQQDKDRMMDDLSEVQPTHFAAVPRIFEKIYNKATGEVEGGVKGKLFDKAVKTGLEVRRLERRGESPGPVRRGSRRPRSRTTRPRRADGHHEGQAPGGLRQPSGPLRGAVRGGVGRGPRARRRAVSAPG